VEHPRFTASGQTSSHRARKALALARSSDQRHVVRALDRPKAGPLGITWPPIAETVCATAYFPRISMLRITPISSSPLRPLTPIPSGSGPGMTPTSRSWKILRLSTQTPRSPLAATRLAITVPHTRLGVTCVPPLRTGPPSFNRLPTSWTSTASRESI
jgi:hypothetical protein